MHIAFIAPCEGARTRASLVDMFAARVLALFPLAFVGACTTFGTVGGEAEGGAPADAATTTRPSFPDGALPPSDGGISPTEDASTGVDAATPRFCSAHATASRCADFDDDRLAYFESGNPMVLSPTLSGSPAVLVKNGALTVSVASAAETWWWSVPKSNDAFHLKVRVMNVQTANAIEIVRISTPGQTTGFVSVRARGGALEVDKGGAVAGAIASLPTSYELDISPAGVAVGVARVSIDLSGADGFMVGVLANPGNSRSIVGFDHVLLTP